MAGDESSAKVDYRSMARVAERGQRTVNRLNEVVDDMERWIGMLDQTGEGDATWAVWDGQAYDAYTTRLKEMLRRLKATAEAVGAYPKDLAEQATDYAQKDGVALNVALEVAQVMTEVVQHAEWANV